jgi:hypothetical protein
MKEIILLPWQDGTKIWCPYFNKPIISNICPFWEGGDSCPNNTCTYMIKI